MPQLPLYEDSLRSACYRFRSPKNLLGENGFHALVYAKREFLNHKNFALVKAMPGNITGSVTDFDTGDPIDGATVEAIVDPSSASQTTETDGTGHYTLSNVLSGRRQVIATARGYSGDSRIVKMMAGSPPATADFTLVRKRSRRG
jgi:Carboxypeptidase regulatory-like domain